MELYNYGNKSNMVLEFNKCGWKNVYVTYEFMFNYCLTILQDQTFISIFSNRVGFTNCFEGISPHIFFCTETKNEFPHVWFIMYDVFFKFY